MLLLQLQIYNFTNCSWIYFQIFEYQPCSCISDFGHLGEFSVMSVVCFGDDGTVQWLCILR